MLFCVIRSVGLPVHVCFVLLSLVSLVLCKGLAGKDVSKMTCVESSWMLYLSQSDISFKVIPARQNSRRSMHNMSNIFATC